MTLNPDHPSGIEAVRRITDEWLTAGPVADDDRATLNRIDSSLRADELADTAANLQAVEGVTERVEQMYADARALRAEAWS